jgi:HK97 family phage portal protein
MTERRMLAPAPAASTSPSWWRKTVTTIADWFVVGPSPKVRDPQNAAGHGGVAAGVPVNDSSAMKLAAFWACVRLIASSIGSLPLPVYRRGRDGEPVAARDSALYKVLHESPNADQTPVDYLEFLAISLLLRGNHFARKLKEGNRLIGLEPIRPDIVTVRRCDDGAIGYRWTWQGERFDLTDEDVFHVRGFGGGPLGGLSVISHARESLGLAIAADQAAASVFRNGAHPSGALRFKEWLPEDKRAEYRALVEQQFAGALNTGRPFVLEGDAQWEAISLKADDAQLLESRGWSVEEICRWFGVPPFMIGHNEKTTSWGTGIEQMLLGFQKFTLMPYLRRIEQAIRKQLLSPAERSQGLFAEFNVEGLLRADSLARARYYQLMTQIGAMTRNEVRAKENLPPIEGGDVVTIQAQYVSLEDLLNQASAGRIES